ncbi:deleted in malignant brain tumors 1 protein-like [Mya arenaria]|uniref:deleted in malignant brain tumors 1 protein-like n=1 Tax=Mya arenaria TaxID=6604 RepID=UPI0022E52079|nr:deleted in malignant brain tumors 1 protein-like [Mya arenaria]
MRLVPLGLILCLTALRPIQGSRLRRLEEDVNALKSFIFRELGSIRDQVKDISIRVEILENSTVALDQGDPIQDRDITSYNIGGEPSNGNNEASHVVKSEVENMRKAYANDKKDLHELKQCVKGQLKELEEKITSHMNNLTLAVQHNIKYIYGNVSLANVTLSELLNGSATHFSEHKFTNLSLELQKIENKTKSVEERILNTFESFSSNLEKELEFLKIRLNTGRIVLDDYYYSSAIDVRLANVSSYRSTGVQGRLEVRHDNKWGTACDDSFSENNLAAYEITNNVRVVCRMFGFVQCNYVLSAGFGYGSGNIWMDHVKCHGRERSFLDCHHRGWGVEDCNHGEDVGFRMWN